MRGKKKLMRNDVSVPFTCLQSREKEEEGRFWSVDRVPRTDGDYHESAAEGVKATFDFDNRKVISCGAGFFFGSLREGGREGGGKESLAKANFLTSSGEEQERSKLQKDLRAC